MNADPAKPAPKGTVYVVDDNASFLMSVSRLLRAAGYTVQAFGSAQEFLAKLTRLYRDVPLPIATSPGAIA